MSSWRVLQLADSAFPTGGFAHSAGLEAAVQLGEVTTFDELAAFVEAALWQTGFGAMPLATAAHERTHALPELDALADAFLTNAVANRASRTQGRAFASTSSRVFDAPELRAIDRAAREGELAGHLAPVFGAALRALDVPCDEMQRLLVLTTLRGATSAAVRLGIIGPLDAQRLQAASFATANAVIARCARSTLDDLAQPAPTFDILAGAHDRLYARLFQS